MINIAIDGPSGVGKTSIAKSIAREKGYTYIDTGALYRALAVYFVDCGIDPDNEKAVVESLPGAEVSVKYVDGVQHVYVNDNDVTDRLRTEDISKAASVTSQFGPVRAKLFGIQRRLAAENNAVMDGRDIGTVILPDAQVKLFLTASPEVQAERRYQQLKRKGKLEGATMESILADIKERDYRDSHRENAPLKKADDAIEIDTSAMNMDDVLAMVLKLIDEVTASGTQE